MDHLPTTAVAAMHAELKQQSGARAAAKAPKGGWQVSDKVDVESEDGFEYGLEILGPAASGSDEEMSVRFADGVVDDWEVAEFRPARPKPVSVEETLVLLVRSFGECP